MTHQHQTYHLPLVNFQLQDNRSPQPMATRTSLPYLHIKQFWRKCCANIKIRETICRR